MNQTQLDQWFREYARVSQSSQPEQLASFYAESFVAAGPKGSAAFNNDAQFIEWLKQVHDFNASSGMQSMTVREVVETPISDAFTMATVEWEARFLKTGDAPITFKISYILNMSGTEPKVVAYISHEDQEEAMKEYGLL